MGHTTRSGKLSGGRASIIAVEGTSPITLVSGGITDRSSCVLSSGVKCGRETSLCLTLSDRMIRTGTMVKTIPWWQSVGAMVLRPRGAHRGRESAWLVDRQWS